MQIQFPSVEAWDGDRDCMTFPADVDGKRIRCHISLEALQDNFGGNHVPPLDSFLRSRHAIEAKAIQLISRNRFEADGSILIRSQDGQ